MNYQLHLYKTNHNSQKYKFTVHSSQHISIYREILFFDDLKGPTPLIIYPHIRKS